MIGANLEDLRSFAKTMDQASASLLQEAQRLSNAVNQGRGWNGPDADRFRQQWNSSHRPTLHATARSLTNVSAMLRKNADDQELASAADNGAGSPGGSGAPEGGHFWDPLVDPVKEGLKATGIGLGVKGFLGNIKDNAKFLASKQWNKFGDAYDAFKTFQAEGDMLAKLGKAGQLIGKTGKLLGAFGRFAGPALAPLGIVSGIHDMFDPDHSGWRGVGDRIAGGLGVIGGGGSLLMAAGLLTNPVGIGIVVGVGVVAGAWALGNMIADSAWGKAAGKWVSNKASAAWNNTTKAVGNVVDGAVNGAKKFLSNPVKSLGGLFA